MIRQLKKANSELWDIIQDYERKFAMTEEAVEANETRLRHESRRREDLRRQLALSIDDQVGSRQRCLRFVCLFYLFVCLSAVCLRFGRLVVQFVVCGKWSPATIEGTG